MLAFLLETLWCWQALAVKVLYTESMRVKKKLEEQDLPGARSAVARIVGRDTQNLDAAGVAKAAIETVAENTSDGVIAPLFFLALGGPPLGILYKAINTLDSMIGYKNIIFFWIEGDKFFVIYSESRSIQHKFALISNSICDKIFFAISICICWSPVRVLLFQ